MANNVKDLSGQVFGRLTAVETTKERAGGKVVWLCICSCGTECKVRADSLHSGSTKSCGCLQREVAAKLTAERSMTHGHTIHRQGSPEYRAFQNAKDRCTNSNHRFWSNYGGAGIQFLFTSFEEFLACLGPRPAGTTLGRYADLSNYGPGECCWMTPAEQTLAAMNKKHLLAWAAAI